MNMIRGGQMAATMKSAYWSQWGFRAYENFHARHAFLSKLSSLGDYRN